MSPSNYGRLVLLGAIWGASFIFIREAAPVFGAIPTAASRPLIAGFLLLAYFGLVGLDTGWRENLRHYSVIGVINSAIPFALFAYAALHLPASYLAIFNATSTLFGTLFAVLWLSERVTAPRMAGLGMGIGGVALVAGGGGAERDDMFGLAVVACLTAAACYGLGATYVRRHASHLNPRAIAASSQVVAGIALLPLLTVDPPSADIGASTIANLLALAVLSSAVGYLLYYRLVADAGPSRALTVTFLIPAFGMLWGAVFLDEAITAPMIGGTIIVIAGTVLVAAPGREASRPGAAPTSETSRPAAAGGE